MPFLLRDSTGHEFPIRGETQLGRGASAQVVINDPCASAVHATVWEQQGRLFIRDEDSRNGTLVNGNRIQQITLRDEDLIRIGNTSLTVVYHAERAPDLTIPLPHTHSGPARNISVSSSLLIVIGGTLLVGLILFGGFYWARWRNATNPTHPTPVQAGAPGSTQPAAILPRKLLSNSEQPRPLSSSEFAAHSNALAQTIADLNWAEIKFIQGSNGDDLPEIAALGAQVARLAESLGQTAGAQDNGSAAAAQMAAPYFSIARLGYALVIEAHNLQDGLRSGSISTAAAVDTIAGYGARLWNPAVFGSEDPGNPFLRLVQDPGQFPAAQLFNAATAVQLNPPGDTPRLQTWLATAQETVVLTVRLPQVSQVEPDPLKVDHLKEVSSKDVNPNLARQVAAAHLVMLAPASIAYIPDGAPAQLQVSVFQAAALAGENALSAGRLPAFSQGTAQALNKRSDNDLNLELYPLNGQSLPKMSASAALKDGQVPFKLKIASMNEISRWKDTLDGSGVAFEVQLEWESSLNNLALELGCFGGASGLAATTASGSHLVSASVHLNPASDRSEVVCWARRAGEIGPLLAETRVQVDTSTP